MVELIRALPPNSPLSLVTQRIIAGLKGDADEVLSAFQSIIE